MNKLLENRNFLGLVFMLPAAAVLLLFLTYPLGLGIWLGFTDAKIGRAGEWIGLENFEFLWGDAVTQLSVFNTLVLHRRGERHQVRPRSVAGTAAEQASARLRRSSVRSCCCRSSCRRRFRRSPSGGSTTLSSRSSAGSLTRLGLIDRYIDFLGEPWLARLSVIAANIWRGVPFVAICLLAGLQTISPSFYEAASLDGATPWQQFRFVTLPLLTPIIAVVMTFSVLFTFTDFQLIYVLTRGGPLNSTHLMATLSFQRAIPGGCAR